MNVRNEASVPTVMSPATTLLPPTQRTSPIAAKNENVMTLVLRTRMPTRSRASSSAFSEAPRNLAISCAWAAKARTTRMPARFSSMTRLRTDRRSCSRSHVARSLSLATEERQATIGTKLSAAQASTEIRRQQEVAADPQQRRQEQEADEAGGEEHPHALEVEHPQGDEVARMHPVVEAEVELLDLGVILAAQLVADRVAHGLGKVVLQRREDAAQHRDGEEQRRGPKQRLPRPRIARKDLRLVDRAPQDHGDQQLHERSNDRRGEGDRDLPRCLKRNPRDPADGREPRLLPITARNGGSISRHLGHHYSGVAFSVGNEIPGRDTRAKPKEGEALGGFAKARDGGGDRA